MRQLARLAVPAALVVGATAGGTPVASSHTRLRAIHAAGSAADSAASSAQSTLDSALAHGMQAVGSSSGAFVVDLTTGQPLYSAAPDVGRLPASVEKIYTTSTALLRFGPNSTLTTAVYGRGWRGRRGGWHGTLYLKGGGDPTFGSAGFDHYAYGTGSTMQQLARLVRRAGITSVHARILGDESYFDSRRGTPPYGYQFSPDIEGSLSALAYNRGLINQGSAYVFRPARYAAQQFRYALRAAGVRVPTHPFISGGVTPLKARQLAAVQSPPMATLIRLTNTPSDNFFAEMLLKGLGAKFGGRGSTSAGAAVVRAQLASSFGIHPALVDGSGLSRADSTTPHDVVTLLQAMATNRDFVNSLAVAGQTGTLQNEMQGTIAQGVCRGKTGSLHDVSNLVGYCRARDGHTLAFAFLMNGIYPYYAHPIQDQMAVALAKYDG